MDSRKKDEAKSRQLIKEAENGNLAMVERLVADDAVDINLIILVGAEPRSAFIEYRCALSVALENGHSDVAIVLLRKGAQCDAPPYSFYYDSNYKTMLAIVCDTGNFGKYTNLQVFKLVLRATKNIHCGIGFFSAAETLARSKVHKDLQRASLYLHEAILRNDSVAMDALLAKFPSAELTMTTFKNYIADLDLTADQVLQGSKGLEYLADKKKFITNETCAKIKSLFGDKLLIKLQVDAFPLPLQPALTACNASLLELFSELQYWLFPEENLPTMPVEHKTFYEDHYDRSVAEIRSRQNPENLRAFLALDQSEILLRLSACDSGLVVNPAAEKLASILFFKKDEKMSDGQPLLDEKQQKTCFMLIQNLYALPDTVKFTSRAYIKIVEQGRETQYQLTQLSERNDKLEKLVEEQSKKIDQLLEIALGLLSSKKQEVKPESRSIFQLPQPKQ